MLRSATEADIPVIEKLACTIWPEAYKDILSSHQLAYMLNLFYSPLALQKQMMDGHQFIILYTDLYGTSVPSGFASYGLKSQAERFTYRLHKLYVLPRLKGKGYGRILLNAVMDAAKKAGGKLLELNVNRNNEAQNFYHSQGFRIRSEEDIDIGKGYFMNDYVMERKL